MFQQTTTSQTLVRPFDVPIQLAAPYRCFVCNAPARSLRPWPLSGSRPSPLDQYAAHIAYLELTCDCAGKRPGCSRVAVLGSLITPLRFATDLELPDYYARVAYNCSSTEAALEVLGVAREAAEQAEAYAVASADAQDDETALRSRTG